MPPSLPILKRLWPGRIRSQLICGVVLVELVFMMLFVGAMVARQQKFLRQQNLEETQMQAATLAVNSLSWILANDVAGLEEILRSQRDHPRLRYAMILSPEGKVLAHTESARLGMYVNDATSRAFLKSAPKMQTLHADRSLLDIAAPIQTRGGEMVGWVRIGHDQHWITDHLHRVVRNGVLYTLLAILAGSILAILLGNRLTRGLDKLLSLSAQIRDGRRDVRMEISGADEISRLGGGLNQMLEAMKESEKLARVLVDRAPEAILVFDTELNHFVDANPNAEQLFGYSREELLALSPIQLYTPDQPQNRPVQEMIAEITERVLTGEEVVCERHIHNAEGRRFVCELRLVRLPPESRKLIRCSYLDITERKRIEEELRENRERLEFAIESGGMGTWDWHPQSGKVLYGKLWLQMLEYAPDEVDSNFAFFLQHLHPDDRPDVLQRLVDHIEGRVPAFKSEHRLHTKSGKWKWVLDSGKVVEWDKEGHATRATGIIVDITERKRAAESLQQAKETAEAANRAKDQFIAVLSHELRTPLTPVLATVVNLQKETHLPADLRTDMEVIQRNVELEAQLIDDLLDVTRISQGKINLRLETVDVHACLQRTLEICREEIDSKRLDVPLEFAAAQPYVQADMARLQQVFWNLLKNAIKFTPEGGCIRIRSSNVGGQIQIEIADTGIGIEPELMPRIFNAFEQGEQTKTRRFGGLGLGLSIAKAVMDLHHGALTCASEGKDKGATFTVTLATVAAPTAAPAQPPPPPAAAQEEKHWKILLVEDHPDTLRILFRLLNKWGYAITSADSVHAALEAAGKERFDLLVSDLGLPDGSGLDIMRQMKSSYGIPGIALSGYGTENDLRQSREAGFEEHLIKPVDIETLRTALQKITVHLS